MLSPTELIRAANRYIGDKAGPEWIVAVTLLSDPDGAWAEPRHVTGATSVGGPMPFFVDRADGLVTEARAVHLRQMVAEWVAAGVPGAEELASGQTTDKKLLGAFIKGILRDSGGRYADMQVPTVEELTSATSVQSGPEAPIPYRASFSQEQFDVLRRGVTPQQMEDKWRIYMEGDWMHFVRSWTGFWIYRLRFERRGSLHDVVEALVNSDSGIYRRSTDAYEVALVDFLIRSLMLGQDVEFPLPPELDAHEGIYQHHVAGTAFPARRVGETLWSKMRRALRAIFSEKLRGGTMDATPPEVEVDASPPEAEAPASQKPEGDDFGLVLASPAGSDFVQDTCFVCGASNTRPGGLPRMACGPCTSRARLPDTGALIRDLIRPLEKGDFPLEGSTLSFLLSPVKIDDRRGWTEFVAGGWGVHEELVPSDDAFDYRLRHCEPWVSGLRGIRAREMLDALRSRPPIEVLRGLSPEARRMWAVLCSWWHLARVAARVRREHALHINQDAWESARLVATDDGEINVAEMLQRIEALQRESPRR